MDDNRTAPPGWRRTYDVDATIRLLETEDVEAISLDGYVEGPFTGDKVLQWIEDRMDADRTWKVPTIRVHAHPSAVRTRMEEIWDRIEQKRSSR